MVKYCKLLVVLAFILCSCSAAVPPKSDEISEEQLAERDESIKGYQQNRQKEMMEMMQQRMLKGGIQQNKPSRMGPP